MCDVMTFFNFIKIIFYSLTCIILVSCSSVGDKLELEKKFIEKITQGSDGTIITSVYDNLVPIGYKVTIAENIGVKRQDIEMSLLCMPVTHNTDISWTMSHFTGGKDFITPVDFMILFSNEREIFRHRISDNHIWNEEKIHKNSNPVILDIYPDREVIQYHFMMTSEDHFAFSVNDSVSGTYFPFELTPTRMCIGLRRTDLLRWRGKVVPAQSMIIKHIQKK